MGIDLHPEFLVHTGTDIHALRQWIVTLIEHAAPLCIAYKFNTAFYEALGVQGWELLTTVLRCVPSDRLTILDGKRSDISSTSRLYAQAAFDVLGVDAVTVSPYLGRDAVEPFACYNDRLTFVLALTSNVGATDFQYLPCDHDPLYTWVVRAFTSWKWSESIGFVVGATHPLTLSTIRSMVGSNTPLLLPGVGMQGADVREVLAANGDGVALINVSRALLQPYVEHGIQGLRNSLEYYHNILQQQ